MEKIRGQTTLIAAIDEKGEIASGWLMQNASKPANIREEDSETHYMTRQAI